MTSFNTRWREVAINQNNKEATINAQRGDIDASLTEPYSLGDSSPTLTAKEFGLMTAIQTDNTQTAARTVTLPAGSKKLFYVENTSDYGLTITLGATNKNLISGSCGVYYTDGTTDGLIEVTYTPFSYAPTAMSCQCFVHTIATASRVIYARSMHTASTVKASGSGLVATAKLVGVADATAIIDVCKNGVSFGTITFSAGSIDGVFSIASDTTFVAGDRLSFEINTANAAARGLAVSLTVNI